MQVKQPIIVFGVGRSGTTIFHRILCDHPNIAWLSGLCGKYPNRASINKFLMQAIDYPIVGKYLKHRFKPWENYGFWENYCKGFSAPFRDLCHEDVTNKSKKEVVNILSKMLNRNRNRLAIKITGWPRTGYLQEIFNDAKFIHIVRDGRAVVNSRLSQEWWSGWGGPSKWKYGELKTSYAEEWEQHNKSFVVLAAIEWKILIAAVEKAMMFVNKRNILEVKYEKLCSDPLDVFKNVIEFCELSWSGKYEKKIKTYNLRNENGKWQKELTDVQKDILSDVLNDYLKKYGY